MLFLPVGLSADQVIGVWYLSGNCTSTISQEIDDSSVSISSTPADNYQAIKSQGAEITVCQVDLKLYYSTSAGNAHIEFWDVGHTTKYGSNSDTVLVDSASTSGVVYNFTWSGTEPVIPSGDFRMHIIREDNVIRVRVNLDPNGYQDTNYDFTNYGSEADVDAFFKIYTR